jgi:glycerol-3-phosphate dehydrogenase
MTATPSPATSLNAARRARDLQVLAEGGVVDVLVIGGGITGTGVALDAASRGLSVALVERQDLAHGTSRWSSKLVHGGLRYLAKGDVGIAFESARERGILMERTAPHLVRPLPFVTPLNDDHRRGPALLTATGFRAGDLLRAAAGTSRSTLPAPRRISASEAALLAPGLRRSDLRGALLHWDGQLVDDARLVIAVARTAAALGARILTYAEAGDVHGEGAVVTDLHGGGEIEIRARHVVNATGVWADTVDAAVELRPSRGAHLVLDAARLGNPSAGVTVPVRGELGRWVFTLPQGDGRVLVGLTDVPLAGPVPDVPEADDHDEHFLLSTVSRAFDLPLGPADVIGRFAGLRPLLAAADGHATADLSRSHRIIDGEDGIVTVVGGKLTTYRRMAEDAVDHLAAHRGANVGRSRTARIPLVGAAARNRLPGIAATPHLVRRYGTEAPAVAALAERDPQLGEPLAAGLPAIGAELAFGLAHEGALTVDDLLDRRTRIGLVAADRDAALSTAEALLAGVPTA